MLCIKHYSLRITIVYEGIEGMAWGSAFTKSKPRKSHRSQGLHPRRQVPPALEQGPCSSCPMARPIFSALLFHWHPWMHCLGLVCQVLLRETWWREKNRRSLTACGWLLDKEQLSDKYFGEDEDYILLLQKDTEGFSADVRWAVEMMSAVGALSYKSCCGIKRLSESHNAFIS